MSKTRQILPRRRVVVVAFDGAQLLDIAGPVQALTTANDEGCAPRYDVRVCGVAAGRIRTASGVEVIAEQIPKRGAIDMVLVPGGPGVHRLRKDKVALETARRLLRRAHRVCAVCTGAFVLAELGLLDGRRAVTHWKSCERLAQEFPAVRVDPDPIFIRDGDVWTTAGVTAGIDLALSLIEDDHGTALAARVARRLVVYIRRSGGQRQFSEPLELQSKAVEPYAALIRAVCARPAAAWTIEAMAAAAGQSERTFHRGFVTCMGYTPAVAVERLRCDLARALLQTTRLKVAQVADKAGFGSESSMQRALRRQLGAGARELRERG